MATRRDVRLFRHRPRPRPDPVARRASRGAALAFVFALPLVFCVAGTNGCGDSDCTGDDCAGSAGTSGAGSGGTGGAGGIDSGLGGTGGSGGTGNTGSGIFCSPGAANQCAPGTTCCSSNGQCSEIGQTCPL